MGRGNYSFRKDLPEAKKTEKQIAWLMYTKRGYKCIGERDDNKWDLEHEDYEGSTFTTEVKEDKRCEETGRVAVEFHSRNKPSGIRVTEADYYIYKVWKPGGMADVYIMDTETLKEICVQDTEDTPLWLFIDYESGDEGSMTANFIFPLEVIKVISDYLGEVPQKVPKHILDKNTVMV